MLYGYWQIPLCFDWILAFACWGFWHTRWCFRFIVYKRFMFVGHILLVIHLFACLFDYVCWTLFIVAFLF